MIPRDLRNNRQRNVVLVTLDINGDSGLVKGGVDAVDGDGVVRVRSVTGDVTHDAQLTASSGQKVVVDEGRNGVRKVDLLPVSSRRSLQ